MEQSIPVLTQICSAKTIQSDKKGFFSEFAQEVLNTAGKKWLKERFAKLKTDEERILSLFNDPEVCDPILGILENVKPVYKQKDAVFSAQRRLQGEKALLTGDTKKALMLLNQAVVRAPPKGVDDIIDEGLTLALAYWTRSQALIELRDGESALKDLKTSVIYGLNIKHSPEYYVRTAKAYALIGEDAKAKISLAIAGKLYHGDQGKLIAINAELAKISPNPKPATKLNCPSLSGGESDMIKYASSLVTVMDTPTKGKFIAAKDNIKTGNVVLVEAPTAACLLPTYFGSHCHHCFQRLIAPVGCENCSGLAFCSYECMREACDSYHKYECQFQDLFIGSGMSILCYIALRILTQAKSVDAGITHANDLISSLCTHSTMRQPDDFAQRAIMAAFLLRCLQKSDYFGQRKTEAVNPEGRELPAAAALLGLLQLLQFNAHEIYETVVTSAHKFDASKVRYIGAAIYKTGSYFNHDCCPGVARYFVGKTIILACTRPLKPGDAVSENYGPIFTKITLKERQKSLKSRYWFDCDCSACKENWPTLQKLDKNVRFKCTTSECGNVLQFPKDIGKDVRCVRCRKNISLKASVAIVIKAEEMYREAANAMKDQKTDVAVELFKEAIDLFHEVAVLPHKDTLIAQESLRVCLADTGTRFNIDP